MTRAPPTRGRVLVAFATIACVAALVAAAVAARFARQYYGERAELRLEPTFERTFAADNAALADPAVPRVVFFGDSRVNQWEPRPSVAGVQTLWRGVDGETTGQMIHRFDNDVLRLAPRAVVIEAGINDLVAGAAIGDLARAEETVLRNLRTVVERSRAARIRVVVMTVAPPARPAMLRRLVWSDGIRTSVERTNAQLSSWAGPEVTVVDTARLLDAADGTMPKRFARDTLHFTSTAYERLNGAVIEPLRDIHAVQ